MQDVDVKKLVIDALEDLKALDVTSIDVSEKTDLTDDMVVASGTSNRHVKSLAANVIKEAKQAGIQPIGVEGLEQGEWVLIDLNAAIVHLMLPKVRDFYDLESLWDLGLKKKEEGKIVEH